jgi:hypothetical protein
LQTAIFPKIRRIDEVAPRIPDYREEFVNWVLMEIATGQKTFWALSGKQLVEPQLIVKDLRMSRAGDEVHNSEVEECNLILSPTAVFSESRFQRTNPALDQ